MRAIFIVCACLTAVGSHAAEPTDAEVTLTGPARAVAGEEPQFRVVVRNRGTSAIEAGRLLVEGNNQAQILAITGEAGSRFDCEATGRSTYRVACSLGSLAPGAVVAAVISIAVPPEAQPNSTGTVRATASMTNTDVSPQNNTATVSFAVDHESDVLVSLQVPQEAVGGTDIVSLARIWTNGPSGSRSVAFTYAVPFGSTVIDVRNSSFGNRAVCATPPAGSRTATCELPFVLPEIVDYSSGIDYEIEITVRTENATSRLLHTASLTTVEHDPNPANNEVEAETFVTAAPAGSANLTLTKVATTPVVQTGAPATFALTVSNLGPAASSQTTVTDVLPAELTFVSSSPGCTGTSTIVCAIPDLAPGTQATVMIVAAAPSTPTTITNNATVASAFDPVDAGNTSSAVLSVVANTSTDLAVSVTPQRDRIGHGGGVTYRVDLVNHGPAPVPEATLTFDFTNAAFIALNIGTQILCSEPAPQSPRRVVCTLPPGGLEASGSRSFGVVVLTSPDALIDSTMTGTAVVTTASPDADPSNNTDSGVVKIVGIADLEVTQTAARNDVPAGGVLAARIRVKNLGPDPARGIVIKVTRSIEIPITFLGASNGVSCSPPSGPEHTYQYDCAVRDLAPGDSTEFDFEFRTAFERPFSVVAIASTTRDVEYTTTTANNSASATYRIASPPAGSGQSRRRLVRP